MGGAAATAIDPGAVGSAALDGVSGGPDGRHCRRPRAFRRRALLGPAVLLALLTPAVVRAGRRFVFWWWWPLDRRRRASAGRVDFRRGRRRGRRRGAGRRRRRAFLAGAVDTRCRSRRLRRYARGAGASAPRFIHPPPPPAPRPRPDHPQRPAPLERRLRRAFCLARYLCRVAKLSPTRRAARAASPGPAPPRRRCGEAPPP